MKITLTTLLCIFLLHSFAQQNFQPGSIQKISGETVQGWIDYRAWGRNPRSIRFRESENGVVNPYTILELSSFAIAGKDRYIRAVVLKDMRPVGIADVTNVTPDSTVTDTAFLRVITEGRKLSLYELVDEKPHYYIKDSTSQYQELFYKVYMVETRNGNSLTIKPIYRDQLRAYVIADGNLGKLEKELKKAKYQETDLASAVNAINGVTPSPSNAVKGARIQFFVAGGASYSSLKTSGYARLEGMSYNSSISPTMGLGVDILSKRQLNAFGVRAEILYCTANFKGESKFTSYGDQFEREYSLKLTSVSPSISFLYSPFRAPSYRVYAGIGLAYNFTSYPKNTWKEVNVTENTTKTEDNFLEYEKNWLSTAACIGGVINNFEFILSGKLYGGFERFNFINISMSTYSLRAAYRF